MPTVLLRWAATDVDLASHFAVRVIGIGEKINAIGLWTDYSDFITKHSMLSGEHQAGHLSCGAHGSEL